MGLNVWADWGLIDALPEDQRRDAYRIMARKASAISRAQRCDTIATRPVILKPLQTG